MYGHIETSVVRAIITTTVFSYVLASMTKTVHFSTFLVQEHVFTHKSL